MTIQNDKIPPYYGKELDNLIAEKVFMWRWMKDSQNTAALVPPSGWLGFGQNERDRVPDFSSDMNAAWRIIDKLTNLSYGKYWFFMSFNGKDSEVRIDKVVNDKWETLVEDVFDDTPMTVAICWATIWALAGGNDDII